jgi:hypothetical protein
MYVSATVNSTKTTITCSYTIKNTSATSKTYNPNYIMLYQKGSLSSSVSLGSITLDSGASVTKTATFTGSGYTTAGSSYVQLSVRWGSNTYTSEQFGILEESGGDSNIVGPGLDG